MKLVVTMILLSLFILFPIPSIAAELIKTSKILLQEIESEEQELRKQLDYFFSENLTKNTDSLAKISNQIPADVMPDIADQSIDAQKIFIIYFLKYSKDMNEEQKIDFGWDLSDSLMLFKEVPEKTIKYTKELQTKYGFDFSEVMRFALKVWVITSNKDELSLRELQKIEEEGKKIKEEGKKIKERTKELDRNRKIINELFKQLGQSNDN